MSATPQASGRRAGLRRPPPTGHVRKSFGHLDAAVAAATFRGLPDGVHHPKQLLEPLRRLGARLPFPREALATLELLFDYTNAGQWAAGGLPLVFPGNAELAGCLGVTERTVRNHLSALERAGVISIERGPGNRRTPVRNARGEIIEAYGINLAPLADRAAEFQAVGLAQAARRDRLKGFMRRIGAALQDVRTALDAVEVVAAETPGDDGLSAALAELAALRAEAEAKAALARRRFEHDPIASEAEQGGIADDLKYLEEALIALAGEANAVTYAALAPQQSENSEETGSAETHFRHDSTNDPQPTSYSLPMKVVEGPTDRDTSTPRLPGLAEVVVRETPEHLPVRPRHILDLCPEFATTLRDFLLIEAPETASPSAFADAARLIALRLGVSDWCWRTGCGQHGRMNAALAVAVALLKPPHEIRKSREAFLAGMLLRPHGELNALASFHALRKRRNE